MFSSLELDLFQAVLGLWNLPPFSNSNQKLNWVKFCLRSSLSHFLLLLYSSHHEPCSFKPSLSLYWLISVATSVILGTSSPLYKSYCMFIFWIVEKCWAVSAGNLKGIPCPTRAPVLWASGQHSLWGPGGCLAVGSYGFPVIRGREGAVCGLWASQRPQTTGPLSWTSQMSLYVVKELRTKWGPWG